MNSGFKTIEEFLISGKTFVIPNYQRGYKWSVQNKKAMDRDIKELSFCEWCKSFC